jgi:hypothetical protein
MKHDNVSMYDAFVWNWSKNVVCDDVTFIAYYINDAIGDEISCPITQEQVVRHKINLPLTTYSKPLPLTLWRTSKRCHN